MTGAKTCHQHQMYRYHRSSDEIIDELTTWMPREDKQSNNQPHPLEKESLLTSSPNWFHFKPVMMMDDDWHGERWIAGVHFSGDKQKRGEFYIWICKIFIVYKMVSLSRPLADFGNPRVKNRDAIGVCCLAKMRTYEIYKIHFNDGQYRTFGNFRGEYKKHTKYNLYDGQ